MDRAVQAQGDVGQMAGRERPMVRDNGDWRSCSWAEALEIAAEKLQGLAGDLGVLVSPSATTEEAYLVARLTRHLGSENLDHRLRRRDFRQQALDPVYPWLGQPIADFDNIDAALIVGSDLRREVPLLAHRIRKSTLKGAQVSFVNLVRHEYLFPVAHYFTTDDLVSELGSLVCAAVQDSEGGRGGEFSPAIAALAARRSPDASHADAVATLRASDHAVIMLGQVGLRHPRFAELRLLVAELARLTGATLGYIPEGANSAGLSLAGVLPHRGVGGKPVQTPGATADEIIRRPISRRTCCFPEASCSEARSSTAATRASASSSSPSEPPCWDWPSSQPPSAYRVRSSLAGYRRANARLPARRAMRAFGANAPASASIVAPRKRGEAVRAASRR